MKTPEIIDAFHRLAAIKLAHNTEQSYAAWIRKYLAFLASPEARSITESERKMELFLSRMARDDYSRISQDQAFFAVLFLYKHVLRKELSGVDALRCRKHTRERYTPTREEVTAMLHHLRNTPAYNVRLAAALCYACGLRVSECCQLRIKDFDLSRMILTVFEAKGDKDRRVRIPEILLPAINRQLLRARALGAIDINARQPVQLPGRLANKQPSWQFHERWHFLFPSIAPAKHPRTGAMVRWCMGPEIIQRAVRAAARTAGVEGKVTPHCLRHSYCSHLLDRGENISRVAEAMGHSDIRTTAGYSRRECEGMRSPIDG